ncbi:uncharacterized protein LOC122011126 [Zingiber officinale]|uniref:uncharacterized protein LOC122011126 n=1 Tax=Zingiber officinale TaxID=94328 RepID=UPI001C4BE706|nr:uncharacterized protein LOC122011126 [Zingiber officinale]
MAIPKSGSSARAKCNPECTSSTFKKMDELLQQILQQQQLFLQQQQHQQRTDSALQNLERQISQLATNLNQMQAQGSSKLPSQTMPNPKNVSSLTLRSGRTITEPMKNIPIGSYFVAPASDSQSPDLVPRKLNSESTQPVQNSGRNTAEQISTDFGSAEQNDSQSAPISAQNVEKESQQQGTEISAPLPFPQRRIQQKKHVEEEKAREFQELVNLFSKVEVNVPLLTMIEQVPKYAKFLKDVCVHKKKLKGNELVSMGKNVSTLIRPIPQKCDDPGVFTVPCTIGNYVFEDAMLDLGASINVMPKSVFLSLGIGPLQPTGVVIQLANRSQAHPTGVIENVLVKVSDLIFPADFYILDMEGDVLMNRAPIILGRPFLKTARTKIDVHAGTLSMEIADVVVQFSIFDTIQQKKNHSISSVYKSEWLDTMNFIDTDYDEIVSDFDELGCESKHSGGCINNREIVEVRSDCGQTTVDESISVGDCMEALPQESPKLDVSEDSVGACAMEPSTQESLPIIVPSSELDIESQEISKDIAEEVVEPCVADRDAETGARKLLVALRVPAFSSGFRPHHPSDLLLNESNWRWSFHSFASRLGSFARAGELLSGAKIYSYVFCFSHHRGNSSVIVACSLSETIDPEKSDSRSAKFRVVQFQSSPAFPGKFSLVLEEIELS